MHRLLLSDKCSSSDSDTVDGAKRKRVRIHPSRKKMRILQDDVPTATLLYQGFNSNPTDQVSSKGCDESAVVEVGQECHLISGGITAIVAIDANDKAVMSEVEAFEKSVLLDPENYQVLGVSEVQVEDPTTAIVATMSPTTTAMPSTAPSSSVGP